MYFSASDSLLIPYIPISVQSSEMFPKVSSVLASLLLPTIYLSTPHAAPSPLPRSSMCFAVVLGRGVPTPICPFFTCHFFFSLLTNRPIAQGSSSPYAKLDFFSQQIPPPFWPAVHLFFQPKALSHFQKWHLSTLERVRMIICPPPILIPARRAASP